MGVGLCEEAFNRGLEFGDGSKYAAIEAGVCKLGEEAFDGIEPRGRGGCEVESPAGMLREPSTDLGMLRGSKLHAE
jgi:hypothetical protein